MVADARRQRLASNEDAFRKINERIDRPVQHGAEAVVIPMVTATTNTKSEDPVEILNSVAREGWELVSGSMVFHERGSESRDKFMAFGQNIAVKGTIIGYYLFKRIEQRQAAA